MASSKVHSSGSQGFSRCFQRCTEVFRVFQGVSRGVQRCSGCFRVLTELHRGLYFFFQKNFFTFNLYYKTRQRLLQNAAALLDDPCIAKRGKGYYKTRQILKNEAKVIAKRGRYYKTRQYSGVCVGKCV